MEWNLEHVVSQEQIFNKNTLLAKYKTKQTQSTSAVVIYLQYHDQIFVPPNPRKPRNRYPWLLKSISL